MCQAEEFQSLHQEGEKAVLDQFSGGKYSKYILHSSVKSIKARMAIL